MASKAFKADNNRKGDRQLLAEILENKVVKVGLKDM